MPFRTPPGQPRDLLSLIDHEVRQRVEEAVEHVSLDVLVAMRPARGLPPPAPDEAGDREAFRAGVRTFLERLAAEIGRDLSPAQMQTAEAAAARSGGDPAARLVAVQVALAKELPDYWQRFEAIRVAHTAEQARSRGERVGLLGHLRRRFGVGR